MPPWLRSPGLRRIVAAIESAGGTARLVGGAVRGVLRKEAKTDIDLACDLPPESVIRAMRRARLRTIPTGLAHGTVTVLAGLPVEITTLRRDVETFGRHARVAFTESWFEDALRRDLTINALYADLDGRIFDPTGGIADLAAGRVRFVGDPQRRIEEDALRILRFFRFAERYGRGTLDAAGFAACARAAAALERLSGERIASEMTKLVAGRSPVSVLEPMCRAGILGHVALDGADIAGLARLLALEPLAGPTDAVLRLAAMLPDAGAATRLADRWRLSNTVRRRLELLCSATPGLGDERSIRLAYYRLGGEALRSVGLIAAAKRITVDLDSLLRVARSASPPSFALGGADVIALGIAQGPRVGLLLREVEAWWMARDFVPTRSQCIDELQRRVRGAD
jgi:poly(A) polymerase